MRTIVLAFYAVCVSYAALADQVNIPKSHVGQSFPHDVDVYGAELAEWKAHMAKVAADAAAHVPKDKANAPYPAPVAPADVMSAVDEDGRRNYQIVDDGPTPDQVLADKKQALFDQVSISEHKAVRDVIPYGKSALVNYRSQDMEAKDAAAVHTAEAQASAKSAAWTALNRQLAIIQQGIFARIATQSTLSKFIDGEEKPTPDEQAQISALQAQIVEQKALADAARNALSDPETIKKAARSPEEQAFVDDRTSRLAKIDAIHHWAAQTNSDIDDLTSANIDRYKIPELPN